jgi:hypothetical protein
LPLALALMSGACATAAKYGPGSLRLPSRRIAAGAGGGVLVPAGPGNARPFGLVEATYAPYVLGPHLSIGGSFARQQVYSYGEAAAFAVVVLGVGGGYEWVDKRPAMHGYLGVPVNVIVGPLVERWLIPPLDGRPVWYGELFARPMHVFGANANTRWELGFFLKRAWGGTLNLP